MCTHNLYTRLCMHTHVCVHTPPIHMSMHPHWVPLFRGALNLLPSLFPGGWGGGRLQHPAPPQQGGAEERPKSAPISRWAPRAAPA